MSRRSGFTVLEAIISVTLMGLLVISMTGVSVRLSGWDQSNRSRAAQVTALRRSAGYWSTVPYTALPAANSTVCDTMPVPVSVRTCAAASSVTVSGKTLLQLRLSATALMGRSVTPDTVTIDRASGT